MNTFSQFVGSTGQCVKMFIKKKKTGQEFLILGCISDLVMGILYF